MLIAITSSLLWKWVYIDRYLPIRQCMGSKLGWVGLSPGYLSNIDMPII